MGGVPASSLSAGPWSCDPDRPPAPTRTPAQCHTRRARRVPPVPGGVAPGVPPDVPPSCSLAPRPPTGPTSLQDGPEPWFLRDHVASRDTDGPAHPGGGFICWWAAGTGGDRGTAGRQHRRSSRTECPDWEPLKPSGDSTLKSSLALKHAHPHTPTHRMGAHVLTRGQDRIGAHTRTHCTRGMHTLQRPAPDGTAAGVESGA